jgi:hypothetical protein
MNKVTGSRSTAKTAKKTAVKRTAKKRATSLVTKIKRALTSWMRPAKKSTARKPSAPKSVARKSA